jgi:hypothetical protein
MEEVFLDVARAVDVAPNLAAPASPQGAAATSGRPVGRREAEDA